MPLCHPINLRLSNLHFCSEFILDKPQQKKFWALAETNTGFFDAEQTQKCLNIFMFGGSSIYLQKKKNLLHQQYLNICGIILHKSANTLFKGPHIPLGLAATQFVNKQINFAYSNISCFPFLIWLIKSYEYLLLLNKFRFRWSICK